MSVWGLDEGYLGYINVRTTIDRNNFDGVAVMHGSPQQHIWTFGIGPWENDTRHTSFNCPCDTNNLLEKTISVMMLLEKSIVKHYRQRLRPFQRELVRWRKEE